MKRGSGSDVRDNMICTMCKEKVVHGAEHRPRRWAYKIPGVRWLVCSKKCAEKYDADNA